MSYLMPQGKPTPYNGPMPAQKQQYSMDRANQQTPGMVDTTGQGMVNTQPVDRTTPVKQAQNANPWAQQGIDPTKPIENMGLQGPLDFAVQGLQYAAQQKYGKQLDQNQLNQLAAQAGYKGGNVTAQQYNAALQGLGGMFGQPVQPTQPAQPANPMQPGQVGPTPAAQQYQQQVPIAGVPQQWNQANPFYAQQTQLMQNMLANPHTLSQQNQNQINERQKEAALSMMQQVQGQNQRADVRSGFAGGGGRTQALNQQAQNDMIGQLLSGQRNTAIMAGQQNRQDELNALNASGQLAQQGFQNDLSRAQLGLGQMNQNRQMNLQELLGQHGINMDEKKFAEMQDQFKKQYGLDFLQYLAQLDQFNRSLNQNQGQFLDSMGLNWAQHQAAQANNFLNFLYGQGR